MIPEVTSTKPQQSVALWLYIAAFLLSVAGFITSDIQDNTHNMIFHGFCAAFWYACASKERTTK